MDHQSDTHALGHLQKGPEKDRRHSVGSPASRAVGQQGAGGRTPLATLGAHLRLEQGREGALCAGVQPAWQVCGQTLLHGRVAQDRDRRSDAGGREGTVAFARFHHCWRDLAHAAYQGHHEGL